jgi:bis(5'-nucleosyl)-tetraphosphatase (symmetrical)
MFGNKPTQWDKQLIDVDKFRFVINAFTRMRFCSEAALDFKYKGEIVGAPEHLVPWFESEANLFERQIIFGHWSALGLQLNANYICLDTGCIWGGELTAYCLGSGEVFAVPAIRAYQDIAAEK